MQSKSWRPLDRAEAESGEYTGGGGEVSVRGISGAYHVVSSPFFGDENSFECEQQR